MFRAEKYRMSKPRNARERRYQRAWCLWQEANRLPEDHPRRHVAWAFLKQATHALQPERAA